MALESKLEEEFRRAVMRHGGRSYKLAPLDAGMPDRMVLWPEGRIDLVELKTATGRLRPIQSLWHMRAAALGTEVVVLYGRDEVLAWARRSGECTHSGPC